MKPIAPAFVKKEILLFNLNLTIRFYHETIRSCQHQNPASSSVQFWFDFHPFVRLLARIASSPHSLIVGNVARF